MQEVVGKIILLCAMFSYGAGQASFPGEWSARSSVYYKYIPTKKTWVEAEIYCQSLTPGAHLASVHSLEENHFIQELIYDSVIGDPYVWIGASDLYKDRTFMWTDGSQFNFQAWYNNEPDNKGGREPCVHFNYERPGKWNDVKCDTTWAFVCKSNDILDFLG
ncbi:lectin-like [Lissotriton helveticus]